MKEQPLADQIATSVITAFKFLPSKRKPQLRTDGTTEWVPLAGIVLEDTLQKGLLKCVALGTGTKVLPMKKVPLAQGFALHDSHAEVEFYNHQIFPCAFQSDSVTIVIAIRAFNRFLIEQCRLASISEYSSTLYVQLNQNSSSTPYTLRPHFKIHFYTSEAPCGDCSMELTMKSQSNAVAWVQMNEQSNKCAQSQVAHLRGRAYFGALGAIRTKPGRADSPETRSKSCSDKLALRQCVSLLLTPTCYLITPENAFISVLVLPESQFMQAGCVRAWSEKGRMAALKNKVWEGGYKFDPFKVKTTEIEFEFSKRVVGPIASNLSAVMIEGVGEETLIGGVLQGRKQFSGSRAGSIICKANMWRATQNVRDISCIDKYSDLKESVIMAKRRNVKEDFRKTLGGWVRNGGNDFDLPN